MITGKWRKILIWLHPLFTAELHEFKDSRRLDRLCLPREGFLEGNRAGILSAAKIMRMNAKGEIVNGELLTRNNGLIYRHNHTRGYST